MKTFDHWCRHYGYDPSSEAATADYAKYQEQLNFFQQLVEPCFQDDKGSAKGSTADSFSYRPKATHRANSGV